MKTLAELLAARAAVIDKMVKINEKHPEFGKAEQEEYDGYKLEVEELDAQIARKKEVDRLKASTAVEVDEDIEQSRGAGGTGDDVDAPSTEREAPSRSKQAIRISIETKPKSKKEYGIRFAGLVRAMAATQCQPREAALWAARAFGKDHDITKALEWGTAGAAAELVPTDWADEVIELLSNLTVIRRMNPRSLGMPNGNMTLPRKTGSASASYVGENTPLNASDASFDDFTMTAKKLMAVTSITSELLEYNAYGVDSLVRDDLIDVIAQAEDSQMLRGTGSATAPTSMLEIATGASQVITSAPTAPKVPTIQEIDTETGNLLLVLLNANVPMQDVYWVMAPRTRMYLENLRDGNGNRAYPEVLEGRFRRYPIIESNQVPINLGVGTNETEIYLVSARQLILADTRRMQVLTTNTGSYQVSGSLVSTFANDLTAIRVISEHDFNVRHAECVAVLDTVLWGAP